MVLLSTGSAVQSYKHRPTRYASRLQSAWYPFKIMYLVEGIYLCLIVTLQSTKSKCCIT